MTKRRTSVEECKFSHDPWVESDQERKDKVEESQHQTGRLEAHQHMLVVRPEDKTHSEITHCFHTMTLVNVL